MYLYVCFDIEDLVHPDSDDIALDIANVLAEEGVVGSMFVVGEKARLWESRGRRDVIAAVGLHDVGFHTNYHSVHPATAEFLSELGWEDGVAEAVRQEEVGVRDMARIFGRYPSAWATPGSSWGAPIPAAMRELGVPATVYAQVRGGETGACWYAGEFNFVDFCFFPGSEDAYADDAAFEAALPGFLEEMAAKAQSGLSCYGLFVAHPTRLRYTKFWDSLNFNRGQNTPAAEYRFAPRRTDEAYEAGLRNLRRLMVALRDLPGIEIAGASEIMHRFAGENRPISTAEVRALAQKVVDEGMLDVDNEVASPAQSLDLLARAVLNRAAGENPAYLLSRTVLGPVELPPSLDAPVSVSVETGLAVYATLIEYIIEKGQLPVSFEVAGKQVGPGALLRGVAAAFLTDAPSEIVFLPGAEEPPSAEKLAEDGIYKPLPGWTPHDPNLRLDLLALHVRLQSWGLKPAVLAK